MHFLITGGTGFIGKALCKKLNNVNKNTHKITVLSRKTPEQVKTDCGINCQTIPSLSNFQDDVDFIINLSGEPIADKRWSIAQKLKITQSRIQTTKNIISFIERCDHKPSCLISGSAIGYYGDQGDTPLTEESTFHKEFTHDLCQQWEDTATQAEQLGVRVCLLRTGLVIGEHGGFLQRMLPPFKLGLGGRIADGQQWMSWIHLDDIVNMILYLTQHSNLNGVFNGTAPEPVTNQIFSQTLAKQLHRPALFPLPAFVLKLALGEMSRLLLTGQKVLPKNFQQAGFTFKYPTLEQALSATL